MIQLSDNITNYIHQHFGSDYLEKYIEYFSGEYNPFLRISNLNFDSSSTLCNIINYKIELVPVKEIARAYKIKSGKEIVGKTLDFILGSYYIQSLSSMIPAIVLNPSENDKVLDMCAAPGSKTTQLAELMNNKGTLIANEISMERLKSLVFNIDKMNLVNTAVLHSKGELISKYFENYFDKILVDAPCSALGITQKKGEVSNWWNVNKAEGLAEIQYKLLVSAIKACKVGGEIVYSTCTISLEENELVIDKILSSYPVDIVETQLPIKSNSAFTEVNDRKLNAAISKARRILPWEIESEGFFIVKLKKIGESEPAKKNFVEKQKLRLVNSSHNLIRKNIMSLCDYYGIDEAIINSYKFITKGKDIYFVNDNWECGNLDLFIRVGSKFGSIDKHQTIQLHTLAAQTLDSAISKNIVVLENVNELGIYLKGGTIKKDLKEFGQKAIKYKNKIIGTASLSKDGLKSQFPRAFRTQEIIL
ncbi:MAG: RsmB/NOP family class I SAM-dependent RNA methyltransferase [Ignavibacteria bacterium]|nr:RsmB/NOP family class I SAM-dependent RNA methyltransferase [Ignavibacteria bacterium]